MICIEHCHQARINVLLEKAIPTAESEKVASAYITFPKQEKGIISMFNSDKDVNISPVISMI